MTDLWIPRRKNIQGTLKSCLGGCREAEECLIAPPDKLGQAAMTREKAMNPFAPVGPSLFCMPDSFHMMRSTKTNMCIFFITLKEGVNKSNYSLKAKGFISATLVVFTLWKYK